MVVVGTFAIIALTRIALKFCSCCLKCGNCAHLISCANCSRYGCADAKNDECEMHKCRKCGEGTCQDCEKDEKCLYCEEDIKAGWNWTFARRKGAMERVVWGQRKKKGTSITSIRCTQSNDAVVNMLKPS